GRQPQPPGLRGDPQGYKEGVDRGGLGIQRRILQSPIPLRGGHPALAGRRMDPYLRRARRGRPREAHARRLSARRCPAVRLRAHAKRDLTAVGPVWRLAALGTKGEVVVEAVAKGLFDFGERRALEGDHVAKAGDGPGKRRRRPRPSRNNLYIPAPILPPV